MNWNTYKLRCHSVGNIIPARPNGELNKTGMSKLREIYDKEIHGIDSWVENAYVEKGILMEDEGILLYSRLNNKFCVKNTERFSNEYIQGEPDIIVDSVIDIKCSFNSDTFPKTDDIGDLKAKKQYLYQLTGYMALTGLKTSKLAYCLIDTPPRIIEKHLRKDDWQLNIYTDGGELRPEAYNYAVNTISKHTYSEEGADEAYEYFGLDIRRMSAWKARKDEDRLRVYDIEWSDETYQNIIDYVDLSRKFLISLDN